MYPGQFKIYKKSAALQATLILPREGEAGRPERDGAVLLEVAPSSGNRQWDWSKGSKISFALGMADLALLLESNRKSIVHDHNGVIKSLEMLEAEDERYAGTYRLRLSQKTDQGRHSVQVPLSGGEYQLLMRLLMAAAPRLIAWA